MKALHILSAEDRPTTLDAIAGWLAKSEYFYYDDWLIVGGRSAKQYIADILEDLRGSVSFAPSSRMRHFIRRRVWNGGRAYCHRPK